MAFNIMTFGMLGVDADALTAGNQQLNGSVGLNELSTANLINANGIPFQQLLLFVGAANNGDLNINAGETAFNLSDMGAGGAVVSLGVTNNNDPIKVRANGLTNANIVGDLTANVYYDNTRGFGLANVRDKTAASSWLNSGDSLTFSTMAIDGVNQFIASASFVVNVNGGGSEHVIIDFDGNVVRQDGTTTAVDGIDLGLIANGTTVSLNFAAHTISIGATTRAMTDAELSLFQQAGLNQVTIGSLNTSTQGFAIKNLTILATDTLVSGLVVQAPATGGETHGTGNDDVLIGSAVADVLNSGAGNDVVYAGAGDDIINAGDGNDRVEGGDGNDIIDTGSGANVVSGGVGNDVLQTQTDVAPDIIDGGAGVDQTIVTATGAGDAYVIAPYTAGGVTYAGINAQSTAGIDVSTTNVEEIVLHAGAGADTILIQGDLSTAGVAQSTVTIYGGDGDDVIDASGLVGSPPVDAELYGEGGNDTISGGGNNDIIDGGDGDDYANGAGGNDTLNGGAGDDLLIGGADSDTLSGGDGNDSLIGNDDSTVYQSSVSEIIYGGVGNDYMRGGVGDDVLDGGDGVDRVSYFGIGAVGATVGVTLDLNIQGVAQNTGGGGWDTLIGIENVSGSEFADTLIGDNNDNLLHGGFGDDIIQAGGGNDVLVGDGADVVGSDSLDGGDGMDTVAYDYSVLAGRTGGVSVNLTSGLAGSLSGGETDTLISIENVIGTAFGDTITGSNVDNVLTGLGGNDTINGDDGNDTIVGGDGNDILNGGLGNDELNAGLGVNQLFGGDGDDLLIAGLNAVNFKAGEVFNGGAGIDTLRADAGVALPGDFHASYFFNSTVSSIERIDFGSTALGDNFIGIGTWQLGGGFATNGTVSGSANRDTLLIVTAPFSGTYSLAATSFTFEDWTSGNADPGLNDRVVLFAQQVAGAAYTLIGSFRDDVIQGAQGNDTLMGGDGDDILGGLGGVDSYFGGGGNDVVAIGRAIPGYTENYALETFDGGSGIDTLLVSGQTADLSNIDIVLTSFEGIAVGGTGTYDVSTNSSAPPLLGGHVTIDQGILSQLPTNLIVGGSGSFPALDGQHLTQQDILTVLMAPGDTINMSTWTFQNWEAQDHVEVVGSTANDTIIGSTQNDIMTGLGGADNINGGAGNDTIDGGSGNDVLNGGNGIDAVYGGDGNDLINLQAQSIAGINSGVGEFAYGGDGDDLLRNTSGNDYLDGGAGNDRVTYFLINAAVTVDLNIQGVAQDTGGGGVDTLVGIEFVSGSEFNDTLIGNGGDNLIIGGSGDDTIAGNGGDDFLQGDLNSPPSFVSTGNDAIDGGAGIDTVNYAEGGGRIEGVNVNLATGVGGTISGGEIDALINVENVFGTRFDDTLIGDGGDNILAGQLGNDLLDGGGGSDTVSFNEEYAPARTTVNNIVSPRTEGVNVNLSTGVGGTISGGETDALISIENVIGTNFGDTITGDNNTNVLDGGGGADTLEGGAGDDAFAFSAGESNGDIIVDFAGNGASVGDVIAFHGYGTAAEGATFVQIDATHWQINSADGLVHDVITLANGATVDASDYIFGP